MEVGLTMFLFPDFSYREVNNWFFGQMSITLQNLFSIFVGFGIWVSLLAGAISIIRDPSNRIARAIAMTAGVFYFVFLFTQVHFHHNWEVGFFYPDDLIRGFAESSGLLLSSNLDIMNGPARGIGIGISMLSFALASIAYIYGFFTTKRRRLMATIAIASVFAGIIVSHAVPFLSGLRLTGKLSYAACYVKMALWFYGLGFLCVIGATERILSTREVTQSNTQMTKLIMAICGGLLSVTGITLFISGWDTKTSDDPEYWFAIRLFIFGVFFAVQSALAKIARALAKERFVVEAGCALVWICAGIILFTFSEEEHYVDSKRMLTEFEAENRLKETYKLQLDMNIKGLGKKAVPNSLSTGYYIIRAMLYDENGAPYNSQTPVADKPAKFAFVAYPEKYSEYSQRTFIINQDGEVWYTYTESDAEKIILKWPSVKTQTKYGFNDDNGLLWHKSTLLFWNEQD